MERMGVAGWIIATRRRAPQTAPRVPPVRPRPSDVGNSLDLHDCGSQPSGQLTFVIEHARRHVDVNHRHSNILISSESQAARWKPGTLEYQRRPSRAHSPEHVTCAVKSRCNRLHDQRGGSRIQVSERRELTADTRARDQNRPQVGDRGAADCLRRCGDVRVGRP